MKAKGSSPGENLSNFIVSPSYVSSAYAYIKQITNCRLVFYLHQDNAFPSVPVQRSRWLISFWIEMSSIQNIFNRIILIDDDQGIQKSSCIVWFFMRRWAKLFFLTLFCRSSIIQRRIQFVSIMNRNFNKSLCPQFSISFQSNPKWSKNFAVISM